MSGVKNLSAVVLPTCNFSPPKNSIGLWFMGIAIGAAIGLVLGVGG